MVWYKLTRSTKFSIISMCLVLLFTDKIVSPFLTNPIWIAIFQWGGLGIASLCLWVWFQHSYQSVNNKYKKYKRKFEQLKKGD